MLDSWLTLKLWTEYIVPTALIILLFIGIALYIAISSFRYRRREKLLKQNGFKRRLKSVGYYNHYSSSPSTYVWENSKTGNCIEESDLMRWSCKRIKKVIKEL